MIQQKLSEVKMVINDKKLDFWIAHNYNVILRGAHGVGKSTQILDAFNRNHLKWMYFSAPTMDPWVDFIGVPKEVKNAEGKSYLELIRPKQFEDDDVEAIMFDEFNRASSKIRNAVMELIQFKSINGRKFNKLRMIWAAINPESEDGEDSAYDVETLDPAQLDRFHIIVNIDNKPSSKFFRQKFGEDGDVAIEWWNTLKPEQKKLLSPRRLDYLLGVYKDGGDISDVISESISPINLITQLKSGSFRDTLNTLYEKHDDSGIQEFFMKTNNFHGTVDWITKSESLTKKYCKFFPNEEFCQILLNNEKFRKTILDDVDNLCPDRSILVNLLATNCPKKIANEIKKVIGDSGVDAITFIDSYYRKSSIAYNGTLYATGSRNKCLTTFNSLNPVKTTPEILAKITAILMTVFDRTTAFKTTHDDAVTNWVKWCTINAFDPTKLISEAVKEKMWKRNGVNAEKFTNRVPATANNIGIDGQNSV